MSFPRDDDPAHREDDPAQQELVELAPARVRLFRITAVGTLLWAIGLAVVSYLELEPPAFDIAFAGLVLGIIACAVTARMDRREAERAADSDVEQDSAPTE